MFILSKVRLRPEQRASGSGASALGQDGSAEAKAPGPAVQAGQGGSSEVEEGSGLAPFVPCHFAAQVVVKVGLGFSSKQVRLLVNRSNTCLSAQQPNSSLERKLSFVNLAPVT